MKHIFSAHGTAFFIATDTAQLRHSISAVYGTEFDGERYLYRFFERKYRLKNASIVNIVTEHWARFQPRTAMSVLPGNDNSVELITKVMEGFNLSTRNAEQSLELLGDILVTWQYKTAVELSYLVPLIAIFISKPQNFARLRNSHVEPAELRDLVGTQLSWGVRHISNDADGDSRSTVSPVFSFFSEFYYSNNLDLLQISKKYEDDFSGVRGWISDRMGAERMAEYGGGIRTSNTPKTVLGSYWDMIESMSAFKVA